MARFHGEVGYGETVETPPDSGVWVDQITEYPYTGDVIRTARTLSYGDNINGELSSGNSISVVANEHAFKHFSKIRYVRWAGDYWTVTSVEVRSPRLILALGGAYNGPKA